MTTDRDTFFNTPLVKFQDDKFTVKDLIKLLTEVEGSRHAGEARGEAQEKLASITDKFGGVPVLTRQAISIGKVVRDALQPLVDDLKTAG